MRGCKMSVAVKEGRSSREKSKSVNLLWRLFPHVFLILTLVAYAALGAVLFKHIEGGDGEPKTIKEYHSFLGDIVDLIRKNPENSSSDLVEYIKKRIEKEFKSIWLQHPKRWTFYGSLFFCCTVFTTVGYGEIYPVTLTGKVVCILYAMLGIPLTLLVITDVGDILAVLLSKAYLRLHTLCRLILRRSWSPNKAGKKSKDRDQVAIQDGTYIFSPEVVVREPMDIRQVLHSQTEVRRKSIHLRKNTEIFDQIVARENFTRQGPLLRSLSCPELDRMPPLPNDYAMWDFTGIGDSMDQLNVPLVLILVVVFAYILFGGLILPLWETEFYDFDSYYFCFITLTTIGFGDIVPNHPKYFMLTSVFIITGMAIMSMAFKLGQSRIVSCYRQGMLCISGGKVETFEVEESS